MRDLRPRVRLNPREIAWLTAFAACVIGTNAVADGDPLTVDRFMAEDVAVWNGSGKFIGTLPQSTFPSLPIIVIDLGKQAVLVKDRAGELVWVDRVDVELSVTGPIEVLCEKLSIASDPDRKTAGTMGLGSACERIP